MTSKRRDEFRDQLLKLAHSFNASLGQFLFTTAAFLMILCSISGARMTYCSSWRRSACLPGSTGRICGVKGSALAVH